ncbi:hypothetical protein SDC9_64226 [bioreactor metagenome]|uniref:Uncharacterized protein n=1 Tax=bioreactor metagenome TaxID=1076179 RepID=A0A644XPC6_9ZZZZ
MNARNLLLGKTARKELVTHLLCVCMAADCADVPRARSKRRVEDGKVDSPAAHHRNDGVAFGELQFVKKPFLHFAQHPFSHRKPGRVAERIPVLHHPDAQSKLRKNRHERFCHMPSAENNGTRRRIERFDKPPRFLRAEHRRSA